jgi:hypothetical protein
VERRNICFSSSRDGVAVVVITIIIIIRTMGLL